MKRNFLILILISLAVSSYGGEDKKQKGFHPEIKFGAEAGLNLAKIIYQNPIIPDPTDFTLLWHAGVYADITCNDKFTFQPELLYSVEGTRFPGFNPSFTIRLNYIEIPLQVKYNFGKGFNIFGGPYVGIFINLSSSMITTVYSNSPGENSEQKPIDMGAVIGLEHQWANGFNIGIKYTQGFYNIVQHNVFGNSNLLLIPEYNLVFSLYVGWTFLKF